MIKYIIVVVSIFSSSCTDAYFGKITSLGSSANVKCYSGGKLVLDTTSTGKIRSEVKSNGYYFVDKTSGNVTEVDADCVFEYIND